jgi:hypothetical protein
MADHNMSVDNAPYLCAYLRQQKAWGASSEKVAPGDNTGPCKQVIPTEI